MCEMHSWDRKIFSTNEKRGKSGLACNNNLLYTSLSSFNLDWRYSSTKFPFYLHTTFCRSVFLFLVFSCAFLGHRGMVLRRNSRWISAYRSFNLLAVKRETHPCRVMDLSRKRSNLYLNAGRCYYRRSRNPFLTQVHSRQVTVNSIGNRRNIFFIDYFIQNIETIFHLVNRDEWLHHNHLIVIICFSRI